MVKIRECVRKMRAYVPGDSANDPSVLKLNQNENRYPPSPKVAEAVAKAAGDLALYPESTSRDLREEAARVFGTEPARVMATNGSDDMLYILFRTFCDPGDEVVSFCPSYTYYATLAAMHDVRYRSIPFDGEYRIPAKLDLANARLALIPNPNAPTGTLFPEKDIRRLIEAIPDGVAVVDEAYADFSGQTAIPLIKEYGNLAIVRTFSKSYALAGLRVGLGFAQEPLMEAMEKTRDFYNVDRLAQAGALAALRDREWLAETTGRIVAARDRTIKAMRSLGLTVHDSAANFILVRFAGAEEAERVYRRLREDNVLVRYFKNPEIADCLRVSVGTDADMETFLVRLEKAMSCR